MDREDWLYILGSLLASAGCGCWWLPAGLICAGGALMFWPFVARILGGGSGDKA